ncbi:MAG: hypothetical protein ABSB78_11020 [Bacteroidota bacterium]
MNKLFFLAFIGSIIFAEGICAQSANRQDIHQQLLGMSMQEKLHDSGYNPAFTEIDGSQRKSVFLAVLYSMIIPGAGEYYAEKYSRGKYFTIAEAGLWLTYAGCQIYGRHVQNDARLYAALNAGVQSEGKDDDYFVNIGNFDNIYQYNEKKLQDRRLDLLYDPSAGYAWEWKSAVERQRYRDLRISSGNILYNSRFIVAAVIANHIVSAISAGKAASDYNKALEGTSGNWHWRLCPQIVMTSGIPDGFSVGIETHF